MKPYRFFLKLKTAGTLFPFVSCFQATVHHIYHYWGEKISINPTGFRQNERWCSFLQWKKKKKSGFLWNQENNTQHTHVVHKKKTIKESQPHCNLWSRSFYIVVTTQHLVENFLSEAPPPLRLRLSYRTKQCTHQAATGSGVWTTLHTVYVRSSSTIFAQVQVGGRAFPPLLYHPDGFDSKVEATVV